MSNASTRVDETSQRRQHLYREALELPAEERAELACSLLDSLDAEPAPELDREEWARAWALEIQKRLAAWDERGEPGVTAHEAISALRRRG
jgi:hypothetical protein